MEDTRNVRIGVGLLVLAFVLVMLWIASRALVGVYIDALWFGALGYASVFRTMLGARILFGAIAFAIALVVLLWNVIAAFARSTFSSDGPAALFVSKDAAPAEGPAPLVALDDVTVDAVLRKLFMAGAVLAAAMLGFSAARNWVVFLNWYYAVPFDLAEPVYGHDVGFYVFTLPAIAYAGKLLSV
ncbi:MAG: COG1615 family transporter, partial [bacterium]|nr:COG1615 family transporter [bacterium]